MLNSIRPPMNDPETYEIFGAAIEVHRAMGRGFLEHVYHPCLAIEFRRRNIPFEQQVILPVAYDGIPLPISFRVDFICYGAVIVEVKALPTITSREQSQVMNYLKASGLTRGVILNFGGDVLGKRRVVWNLPNDVDPLRQRDEMADEASRETG
jgi:GxxExxY protein